MMDFTVSRGAHLRTQRGEMERLLAQLEGLRASLAQATEIAVKETTALRKVASDAERVLRLERDDALALLVRRNGELTEQVIAGERREAGLRQALDASERECRLLREEVAG